MSILKILTIPDPKLKHKSIRVNNFNNDLKNEINDMYDTLYASGNGIGLAAPQVGILKRIVVIDLKENETSNPLTLVNPEIIKRSEQKFINEEGCLSVPEYYAEVERYQEIEFEWFDENGIKKKSMAKGLLSVCVQHEIDHLNGVLFIDYLSSLKRKMVLKKLNKISRIKRLSKNKNA